MSFSIGQSVSFGRPNGEKTTGVIEKINAKSVVVRQSEDRGRHKAGSLWNVSPLYVTALDAQPSIKNTPPTPVMPVMPAVNDNDLWNRYAPSFGLPLNLVGTTLKAGGVEYRVTGLNPRRHKFPVACVRVRDGVQFKFTAQYVANAFKAV